MLVRIRVTRSRRRRADNWRWRGTRICVARQGVTRIIRVRLCPRFAIIVIVATPFLLRSIRVRVPTRCRKRTRTEIVALYRRRHRRRPRVTLRMPPPGVDRPVRVHQACFEVPYPFCGRTLGILDPTDGHLQHLPNRSSRLAHVLRRQKDGRHLPDLGVRDDNCQAATRGRGRSRTTPTCNLRRLGALRRHTILSGPTLVNGAPTAGIDHCPTATRRTRVLPREDEAVLRKERPTDPLPRWDMEPVE